MQKDKPLSHDRLLSECFLLMWNKYPQTRYTFFHVMNESRPVNPDTILRLITTFLSFSHLFVASEAIKKWVYAQNYSKEHIIRMSQMKGIGVVPGVLDFAWYWKGRLIVLDAKVGSDKLSIEQKAYISAIEAQGGYGSEFRSVEEFHIIIKTFL